METQTLAGASLAEQRDILFLTSSAGYIRLWPGLHFTADRARS